MTTPRLPRPNLYLLLALCSGTLIAGCPAGGSISAASDSPFEVGRTQPIDPGPEPAIFSSQPIFETIPGKVGSHAPTIATLSDGSLLAAWYSYDGPHELEGATVYAARSSPKRDAWEAPYVVADGAEAHGNPVLSNGPDGLWLFYAVIPGGWSTARVEQRTSADDGRTWTSPRGINGSLGTNVRFPPVVVDGGWLLPAYDDLWARSRFFFSPDGKKWTLRSTLATAPENRCLQPSVAALSDGRLLAVMRNVGKGFLWTATSEDDGRSWTQPVDAGLPNPASPAALLRLRSGLLALVLNDSPVERRPLSIALSPDDGKSWTTPAALVDGPGDYSYPSVIESADGLLHVVYSHDRAFIGHLTVSIAWVIAAGG